MSSAGVAAVIRTPQPGPVPQSVSDCLLLENIQDPGNLGSIFRTAVAAGVSQVFLSKTSVFAWSPKVMRAGMGAHFFLSIFEGVDVDEFNMMFFAGMPADIAEYIQASSRVGRAHVGTSVLIPTPQQRRDRYVVEIHDIFHRFLDLDLKGPIAWVFGNEGAGLSERAGHLATHRVRIPMPGSAESLNVAAAVAICLFEQSRQRSGG